MWSMTNHNTLDEERLVRLVAAALPHRDLRTIRKILRGLPSKPGVTAEVEAALAKIRAGTPSAHGDGP